ncbi:MAG: hypothetical protein ACU843_16815 [Gammaproteobacteria bacterium]
MNAKKSVLFILSILLSSYAHSDQIPQHENEAFGKVTAVRLDGIAQDGSVRFNVEIVNGNREALEDSNIQVCSQGACQKCDSVGDLVTMKSEILPAVFKRNYECMGMLPPNPNSSETDLTLIRDLYDITVMSTNPERKFVDLSHFLASASAPPGIGDQLLAMAPGMVTFSCITVLQKFQGLDSDPEVSTAIEDFRGGAWAVMVTPGAH